MEEKVILINIVNPIPYNPNPKNIFELQQGPHFPLGINTIGLYLKKRLPNTPLLTLDDQLLSINEIKREIKKFKPTIVGIGSMFTGYEKSLTLAREVKKNNAKVVFGGHYPSSIYQEVLKNRGINSKDYCVDLVVRGDGEKAFYEYVIGKKLPEISNIAYYNNNILKINKERINPLCQLKIDKEIIDPIEYFKKYQKNFPYSKYKNPFVTYSQKGCAWRANKNKWCLFCSLMHKHHILKNPKIVWSEYNNLTSNYNIDYIWETADDLLGNKNWFKQYCQEAKKFKNTPYLKIQSRINHLTNESIVKELLALKVKQLFIGFESNDDDCLKLMNKGTNSAMNEKAVDLLLKYNIPIEGYFVLGNLNETSKSLKKTIKLAEKIISSDPNNLIVPSFFTPLPNSISFEMIKKITGEKYINKDIIDWADIIDDWMNYYCRASHQEISNALKYMRNLSKNFDAFSY